jgi:hypothetical protein
MASSPTRRSLRRSRKGSPAGGSRGRFLSDATAGPDEGGSTRRAGRPRADAAALARHDAEPSIRLNRTAKRPPALLGCAWSHDRCQVAPAVASPGYATS